MAHQANRENLAKHHQDKAPKVKNPLASRRKADQKDSPLEHLALVNPRVLVSLSSLPTTLSPMDQQPLKAVVKRDLATWVVMH